VNAPALAAQDAGWNGDFIEAEALACLCGALGKRAAAQPSNHNGCARADAWRNTASRTALSVKVPSHYAHEI
jgi:hypothetical protein